MAQSRWQTGQRYSLLREAIGSRAAARRAGRQLAPSATAAKTQPLSPRSRVSTAVYTSPAITFQMRAFTNFDLINTQLIILTGTFPCGCTGPARS